MLKQYKNIKKQIHEEAVSELLIFIREFIMYLI